MAGDFKQPGLVEGVPAPGRGLEQDGPFQPKPFYNSMNKQSDKECLTEEQKSKFQS